MATTDFSDNDVDVWNANAWGNLSVFQRVMRQWSQLHPYNAVHVFRIEGKADLDALSDAILRTWRAMDFGVASIQGHRYRFSCPEEFRPEMEVIEAGEAPLPTINAHLTERLNFRFPTHGYAPVRFSVVQEAACHHLCVTYDHWIGDGVAIRALLQPVICGYCGQSGYESADEQAFGDAIGSLTFYPPTYREAYRDYFSSKLKRLVQWWQGILANNVTILVPSRGKESMQAEYMSLRWPDEVLQSTLACAKQNGVTVHDVFLAAITRACMPFLPEPLVRRKRRRMGIGSIVDARGLADADVSNAIGVYLGYFITHTRADLAESLGQLAQVVAQKTNAVKEGKRYLNTAIGMKIQSLMWPIIPPPARAAFLRNSLPLSAGITNSNVKEAWMIQLLDASPRRLLSYYRAAPTGPIIPISFAPTTVAGSLQMGITWRPSCFTRDAVETIAAHIEKDLLEGR